MLTKKKERKKRKEKEKKIMGIRLSHLAPTSIYKSASSQLEWFDPLKLIMSPSYNQNNFD
jgi:hypothetical protein